MKVETPFNPLAREHLARSVAEALLSKKSVALAITEKFEAAGVYAIYYRGSSEPYVRLAEHNDRQEAAEDIPIYVGKAMPEGSKATGSVASDRPGTALFDRLAQHAESIEVVDGIELRDFQCRYLAVDSVWIPLGEALLIHRFMPLWNKVVKGFGNHHPGKGRFKGKVSDWDVLHPGRSWVQHLQPGNTREQVVGKINAYYAKHL